MWVPWLCPVFFPKNIVKVNVHEAGLCDETTQSSQSAYCTIHFGTVSSLLSTFFAKSKSQV